MSIDAEGHKRKIRIADPEDGFYYHEELNAPGEPVLTDDELVEYCSDEATSYFDRSGFCWDSSWSRKIR